MSTGINLRSGRTLSWPALPDMSMDEKHEQHSALPEQDPSSILAQQTESITRIENFLSSWAQDYDSLRSAMIKAKPVPTSLSALPSGMKLEPPALFSCSAKDNAQHFITSCNDCFSILGVHDPDVRIVWAGQRLAGDAKTWYHYVRSPATPAHDQIHTWSAFEKSFLGMFQHMSAEQMARNKLRRASQRATDTVSRYTTYMRTLFMDIPTMSDADRLDWYRQGLKEELRRDKQIARAKTFSEATELALELDEILRDVAARDKPKSYAHSSNRHTYSRPQTQKYQQKHEQSTFHVHHTSKLAKLSDEEKALYRQKGWCTFCRSHDHLIENCTHPQKRDMSKKGGSHQTAYNRTRSLS